MKSTKHDFFWATEGSNTRQRCYTNFVTHSNFGSSFSRKHFSRIPFSCDFTMMSIRHAANLCKREEEKAANSTRRGVEQNHAGKKGILNAILKEAPHAAGICVDTLVQVGIYEPETGKINGVTSIKSKFKEGVEKREAKRRSLKAASMKPEETTVDWDMADLVASKYTVLSGPSPHALSLQVWLRKLCRSLKRGLVRQPICDFLL